MSAKIAGVVLAAVVADRLVPKGRARAAFALAGGIGLLIALARWPFLNGWMDIGRPLPLLMLLLALAWGWLAWRARQDLKQGGRYIALEMWAVLSLALLGKMALHARIYQYGFYLAMPAVLLVSVALVQLIPEALHRVADGGTVFRALSLGMLGAFVFAHLSVSDRLYAQKTLAIGAAGDEIITLGPDHVARNAAVAEALKTVASLSPEGSTVAVLPEGVMLNYLVRRQAPTRFITFLPPELATFGEGNMLAELRRSPPEVVVLIHSDPRDEYGVPFFGQSAAYGAETMAWVHASYDVVRTIGGEPLVRNRFGLQILRRRH
jgi:hypothetical protein